MPDTVLLLHGILRTQRSMRPMEQALRAAGFDVLDFGYDSRRKPLENLAADVARAIEPLMGGDARLHVVTHSMGGLLARVTIARHRPDALGRVVMLAPPNQGSEVADFVQDRFLYRLVFGPAGQQLTTSHGRKLAEDLPPVDYPLGIIAGCWTVNWISSGFVLSGANDGRVTIERTKLPGMADHIVVCDAHPFLMRNPVVIEQTIAFLRDGQFVHGSGLADVPLQGCATS